MKCPEFRSFNMSTLRSQMDSKVDLANIDILEILDLTKRALKIAEMIGSYRRSAKNLVKYFGKVHWRCDLN